MRSLVFEGNTWSIYKGLCEPSHGSPCKPREELREKDKKLHKNLCKLLKEMLREDPSVGTGKPEPLKHNLSGFWSRRLSQKDRIIYKFDDRYIYIFAIGGHYQ